MLSQKQKQRSSDPVLWWLKFMIIAGVFGLGTWFGHRLASLHYEVVLADERAQHADICSSRVDGVLERITLKFCAAWNVSIPPYDESVAEFITKEVD